MRAETEAVTFLQRNRKKEVARNCEKERRRNSAMAAVRTAVLSILSLSGGSLNLSPPITGQLKNYFGDSPSKLRC